MLSTSRGTPALHRSGMHSPNQVHLCCGRPDPAGCLFPAVRDSGTVAGGGAQSQGKATRCLGVLPSRSQSPRLQMPGVTPERGWMSPPAFILRHSSPEPECGNPCPPLCPRDFPALPGAGHARSPERPRSPERGVRGHGSSAAPQLQHEQMLPAPSQPALLGHERSYLLSPLDSCYASPRLPRSS